MSYDQPDHLNMADERVERLICRRLDGEISASEQSELDRLLARDPAARRLLSDYARIDDLASRSLRHDFNGARAAARPRQLGGFRLAAAGAVLAAAAVVAFSFLPNLWRTNTAAPTRFSARPSQQMVSPPAYPRGRVVGEPVPQFVNYRDADYLPQTRQQDVLRDLIGVRTKNEKNQDVIYIFERNTESTKIVPLSSDF